MSQTKVAVGMIDASSIGDAKLLQGDGSWVDAPSAGLTFISTTDISDAATYNFTAVDASSYDGYAFFIQNIIPATDSVGLLCRTSTDGGSSYDSGSSDYSYGASIAGGFFSDNSHSEIKFMGTQTSASYMVGSATGEHGCSGWIYLIAPHLSSAGTIITSSFHFETAQDGTVFQHCQGGGIRHQAEDVDAIQFYFSSGNIESGTVTAYGLANA